MPTRAEHDFSATKSGSCTVIPNSTTNDDAPSMASLACTYPKTSFKRNVHGTSVTVPPYTGAHTSMIANMTSLSATRENTGVSSIITVWHTTLHDSGMSHGRWKHRSSK